MEVQLTPDQAAFIRQAIESGRLRREEANAGVSTKNGVVVTGDPVALGFLKQIQSLDNTFIDVMV